MEQIDEIARKTTLDLLPKYHNNTRGRPPIIFCTPKCICIQTTLKCL